MPGPIAVETSLTTPTGPGPNAVAPPGACDFGVPTVFAGGFPIATVGSTITPHGNPKINQVCVSGAAEIIVGSDTVFAMGFPVATVGSLCDCGHAIAVGIPTVIVGL